MSVPAPVVGAYPDLAVAGDVVNLRLFIAGKPVSKGRPRARIMGKGRQAFVHVYTDDTTVNWEDSVAWQARAQVSRLLVQRPALARQLTLPLVGRVIMMLRFNFLRPASTPKSVLYPVKSRSDVDNLAKAVLDALQNANILVNDNIVTDLVVMKRFCEPAHEQGAEIDITGWR